MNYQDFVHTHRTTGADITVAALPTDEKQATAFGLMKIDGTGRIQVTSQLTRQTGVVLVTCMCSRPICHSTLQLLGLVTIAANGEMPSGKSYRLCSPLSVASFHAGCLLPQTPPVSGHISQACCTGS